MMRVVFWRSLRILSGKLGAVLALLIGVTFGSYLLIMYFAPDMSHLLVGKNPSAADLARLRAELGYGAAPLEGYLRLMWNYVHGDLGRSYAGGAPVAALLGRALPVSLALLAPGFIAGHLAGFSLAALGAIRPGRAADRWIMRGALGLMSLSFPVVIIVVQIALASDLGLHLFPLRGWPGLGSGEYWRYVTVPTAALLLVTVGYNVRFYRVLIGAELERDYVRLARAYGAGGWTVIAGHVLGNILPPVATRIVYSLPALAIGGSLLLETYFGVPGIGLESYRAVMNGDQPVLMAIVTLSAVLLSLANLTIDALHRRLDPRLELLAAA